MSEELTLKDVTVGCALALKCLHLVDGPCNDSECTICEVLRHMGKLLEDGVLDSDIKLAALEKALREIRDHAHAELYKSYTADCQHSFQPSGLAMGQLAWGRIEGHRCAAEIARRSLEGGKE